MKELAAQALFPLPTIPYVGVSFAELSDSLLKMNLPSLCDKLRQIGRSRTANSYRGPCSIKGRLQAVIKQSEDMLAGLKLDRL